MAAPFEQDGRLGAVKPDKSLNRGLFG